MKNLVYPLAIAGLTALTACTPAEQRAVARAVNTQTATARDELDQGLTATEPTLTVSVDCAEFTVTVDGYPDGTEVYLGMGSQPPWSFTVDGPHTSTSPIGLYESTHTFEATVDIALPGASDAPRAFDQLVDCTFNN